VCNSEDGTVGSTATKFKVNFTNAPFVGKNVVKICPKQVQFPNSLFNVLEGYNDEIYLRGQAGVNPYSDVIIHLPPGFYSYERWMIEFNKQCVHAGLDHSQLKIEEYKLNGDEKFLTFTAKMPQLLGTDWMALYHPKRERIIPVLNMLGIKPMQEGDGVMGVGFEMQNTIVRVSDSPGAFNWNSTVLLDCNISHSNSVNSNPKMRLGNVLDVVNIDPDIIRSEMVTLYHDDDALSSFYLPDGDSIQDIEFTLRDKYGRQQVSYEGFRCTIILKIFYV